MSEEQFSNGQASRNNVAEVIAIGDEMTGGARVDTNSAWIAKRLQDYGFEVKYHSMVGDDFDDCVEVFRTAATRSDIAVCTGGLGPTRDDLTRESLAKAADVELQLDPASLEHIETMFARRNRAMPDRNQIQAMFPVGSRVIFNPQGTAPGVDWTLANQRDANRSCRVFALPGVPAEMKQMFDDHVVQQVADDRRKSIICCRVMKFFGVGESDMEALLGDMIARGRQPRVGITVSSATISLRLTAIGTNRSWCDERLLQCGEEILRRAGQHYFGEGEHYELHHAVSDLWSQPGQRFGVLEIGHACPLMAWFGSIETETNYVGGIHVRRENDLLRRTGQDNLRNAAEQWMESVSVNRLIVVDAYPPIATTDDRPLKATETTVQIYSDGQWSQKQMTLGGHPSIIQPRIGKAALAFTREVIQKSSQ